jgi:entericidin B
MCLFTRTFFLPARFWCIDLNTLTEGAKLMVSRVLTLMLALGVVAGCANTIRGVGQDTANVVDATQSAGENVGNSAAY